MTSCAYLQKTCNIKRYRNAKMIKNISVSWSYSSALALEKQPKNLNFLEFFLPLRDPLVATFNETRVPTSIKHVAEQGIVMPS